MPINNRNTVTNDGAKSKKTAKVDNYTNPANDGMNLSGVDNISVARGTPKVSQPSSGPTGINTDASNLAGTNNIRNAGGTPSVSKPKNNDVYQATNSSNKKFDNNKIDLSSQKAKTVNNTKKESQKTTVDSYKPFVNYKQSYTNDDVAFLREDYANYLANSPFVNSDIEYKGESYEDFSKTLANKRAEVKTAEAEVAMDKKLEDLNATGKYSESDIGYIDDYGKYHLYDYSTEVTKRQKENQKYEEEIRKINKEKSKYADDGSLETYRRVSDLDKRIAELQAKIDVNNVILDEQGGKLDYQTTVLNRMALDKAKSENDNDVLESLYKTYESYDDSFVERRIRNVGKIGADMMGAIASTIDIVRDFGGEKVAEIWENGAKSLYENGNISVEQYNQMVDSAKAIASFEATSSDNLSTQLRELSAQIQYDIENGEDGVAKFIGQGIDSTANFLTQYLMLGPTGSLLNMSTQSATQKYFDNIQKGYSMDTALLNAVATGVTSYLTEKIGMDNFVANINGTVGQSIYAQALNSIIKGNSNLAFLAQTIASQGIAEGLEEVIEGNVDYALDAITAKLASGEPVEYNAGDIFYSMLVGAFSGALTGGFGGYNGIAVNTREQYNALESDVNKLVEIRNRAVINGENVDNINRAIAVGEDALNNFRNKSATMGVTYANELVDDSLSHEGEKEIITESSRPEVDEAIVESQETDALIQNVMQTSQGFLEMNDINMPVEEFVDMPSEQRTKFVENAHKISQVFPNVNLSYSSSIGDNAVVIKMDGSKPVIVVNPNGETSVVVSTIHEVVHTLENTDGYSELFNMVFPDTQSFVNKVNELSQDRYKGDDFTTLRKEALTVALTEDLMGDEGAQSFIDHLAKYNTSTAYKLLYNFRNATGIFRDNSQLGRITSLLTNALENQDVVYLSDDVAYSKRHEYDSRWQLSDFIAEYELNGDKAYLHGKTRMSPLSRIGKYQWMPEDTISGPIIFQRKAIEGILTGQKMVGHNQHGLVSPDIIKNLDYLMDNPLAVFKSKTIKGAYMVILNARDNNGYPIIASLNPVENAEWKMNYYDVNFDRQFDYSSLVTGLYGKDNFEFAIDENGNKYLTKAGQKYIRNFFADLGEPIFPKGETKSDVSNSVVRLLLSESPETSLSPSINDYLRKSKQLELIQDSNPMTDDYHTGIRSIEDILTFEEAIADPDELFTTPDWTEEDIQTALNEGRVMVYSSHPIEDGVFVTPSATEARNYAGKEGQLYGKYVNLSDVAWIDSLEGQYAPVVGTMPIDTALLDNQTRKQKVASEESKKIGTNLKDYSGIDLSVLPSEILYNEAYKLKDSDNIVDLVNSSRRLQELVRRIRFADNEGPKYYGLKMDAFETHPELTELLNSANEIASKIPKTFATGVWDEYKNHINNKFRIDDIKGNWAKEHLLEKYEAKEGEQPRAVIVMGLPGAGKSTALAGEVLLQLDSDDIKFLHPLYKEYGGIASGAVHEESGNIMGDLTKEVLGDDNTTVDDLRKQGKKVYNIALPKIFGHLTDARLQEQIDTLRKKGYKVSVKLVDISNLDSQVRNASRFAGDSGRIIPIEAIESYGDRPYQNFISTLEKEENSDVEFKRYTPEGEAPLYRESERLRQETAEEGDGGRKIQQPSLFDAGSSDRELRYGTQGRTQENVSRSEPINDNESTDSFSNGNETIQFSAGGENGLSALLKSKDPELRARGESLKTKLIEANNLEKSGSTQEDIWDRTGWIKKSDGKWRFQFYDGAEDTVQNIADVLNYLQGKTMSAVDGLNLKISDLVGKDNILLEMYPELNNVTLSLMSEDSDTYGSYSSGEDSGDGVRIMPSISINLRPFYDVESGQTKVYDAKTGKFVNKNSYQLSFDEDSLDTISTTFFHELQHAIQDMEGFEQGSNLILATQELLNSKVEDAYQDRNRIRKQLIDSGLNSAEINQALNLIDTGKILRPENANIFTPNQLTALTELKELTDFIKDPGKFASDYSNEIFEQYRNNLGEVEAREEASRSIDEDRRQIVPSSYGNTNNLPEVQFSRRSNRVEGEVVDSYGETRQQRFPENLDKSTVLNDAQKEDLRQRVANNEFTYQSLINKVEVQRAREYMERDGVDKYFKDYMDNNSPSAKTVVAGEVLLTELAKNNDPRWEQVATKLADDATTAGQFLQAYAIMQRLTPEGQLRAVTRNLNRMQQDLDNRFGNKAPRLELKENLRNDLLKATTAEEAEKARDAIYNDLMQQTPKTISDVLNSWRYLAMLGNPRTHIRNILGNGVFVPAIELKNAIGTVLESTVGKSLGMEYRSKSVLNPFSDTDKALIELGKTKYEQQKGAIEKNQKYERKQFSGKNIFGRGLNRLSDFNSWALDKEDFMFSKDRYARSYAQFLKSNGIDTQTLTEEMDKRASEYALLEAERATYRDANAVADWLNELEYSDKKGLRMASAFKKAVIPFTKTPMNIIKRGARYSPAGLLYTITYDSKQLADGKINANQFLDNMASGLTGTAISMLGALLASMGLFRTKDDDKDRKQYFDSENGEQDYALDLSPFGVNATYTIDWASPVIMPFAMGAELFNSLKEMGSVMDVFDSIGDISAKIFDPMIETSMLSSLQDALKSYSTNGGEWLGDTVLSVATSYISQLFPTVGGQIARTIDDTRRTTYPNSGPVNKALKQIYNKIPWMSMKNQPYINKQGLEEKTEDLGMGMFGRAILNMLSPGYYSSKDVDEYDEELYRLYDSTGSLDAFPSSASRDVTFDKDKFKFTPEEYTQWHKTRWQIEAEYVNQFIDSKAYQNLDDDERVATIDDIRSYAQKVAKKQFLESKGIDYEDDKQLNNAQGAIDNGIELYNYFDYLNNAGTKQAEKVAYLEGTGLSKKQKEYLWSLNDYKKSYQDVYNKVFGGSNKK